MHRKRVLCYFRNSISAILALSMIFGNIGTGVNTVLANENVSVTGQKIVEERTDEELVGGKWDITCDKNGAEFSTDTLEISFDFSTVTVAPEYRQLVSCTYSVDNGPIKNYTEGSTIEIGEGKIGDSEITVDVTAEWSGGTKLEKTFTFKKLSNEENVVTPTPVNQLSFKSYKAVNSMEMVTVFADDEQESILNAKAGEEIALSCDVYDADGSIDYRVMYTYLDEQGREVIFRGYEKEKETKAVFYQNGNYPLNAYAVNEDGSVVKKIDKIIVHVEGAEPTITTEPTIITEPTVTIEPTITIEPTVTTEPTITVEPTVTTEPTITVEPTVTTEPTITIKPTVTTEPDVTVVPTDVIHPSKKPTPTQSVTPTVKPTVKPTGKATATPTQKATATPNPTQADKKLNIKSFTTSIASGKAHVGDTITLKADAEGGNGTLKYQFSYTYNGKDKIIKSFGKTGKAAFKPKKAGKYALTVKVKDSKGNTVSKTTKTYNVKAKFSITDIDTSYKSGKLKVNVSVQGAEDKLKYKYVLKRGNKTVKSTSFKSSKSLTVRNLKKGSYKITVYVKDSNNKTIKKTISFKLR